MRRVKTIIVVAILSSFMYTIASAKPEYAKKEGKACTYCHIKMGSKELNDGGKYYKAHNHTLKGYTSPAKAAKA